jgi:hypothetical protein
MEVQTIIDILDGTAATTVPVQPEPPPDFLFKSKATSDELRHVNAWSFRVTCEHRLHKITLRKNGAISLHSHGNLAEELEMLKTTMALGAAVPKCLAILRFWRKPTSKSYYYYPHVDYTCDGIKIDGRIRFMRIEAAMRVSKKNTTQQWHTHPQDTGHKLANWQNNFLIMQEAQNTWDNYFTRMDHIYTGYVQSKLYARVESMHLHIGFSRESEFTGVWDPWNSSNLDISHTNGTLQKHTRSYAKRIVATGLYCAIPKTLITDAKSIPGGVELEYVRNDMVHTEEVLDGNQPTGITGSAGQAFYLEAIRKFRALEFTRGREYKSSNARC